MAKTLILDSEALNALARPSERGALTLRARAILAVAHEEGALIRVPSPVLAEVCRGARFDAAVDRVLNGRGILVMPLSERTARHAGALLARLKLGSSHAVDAFVAASAAAVAPAMIATHDAGDLRRLTGGIPDVTVLEI